MLDEIDDDDDDNNDDECDASPNLEFGFLVFSSLNSDGLAVGLVKDRMSSRLKSLENRFDDADERSLERAAANAVAALAVDVPLIL